MTGHKKIVRVLFLIDKLTLGGTQTNLLEIVKGLDRTRFSPHVIALVAGGSLAPKFRTAGAEAVELHVRRAYDGSALRALVYLIHYMKRLRIDIVQTHFLHADILGAIAGTFAGVPRIVTSRRDEGFWRGGRQRLANRVLNLFCNRILVNSEAVKKAVMEAEGARPKEIFVIHNGVDTKRFYPSSELRAKTRKLLGIGDEEIVVGVLANMRHGVKGHSYLIEAMPEIIRHAPHAKLLFVGDGSLRGRLENLAGNLRVRRHILFAGSRPDVNDVLNASDISCLPSLSEGFSNSILESMAAGLPVVATKVGGNPEVVTDGETGLLVPPRSSNALAAKLLELIPDEKRRRRLGEAGRERIQSEFRVEQMVKKYEEFYEKLRGLRDHSAASRPQDDNKVTRPAAPVRLLYLIWSLDLGGAEQVVVDLARRIDRRFFEPVVCCLNDKGRSAPRVEAEGVRVIALHKRPKFDPLLIPRLVRFIKEEKIGLIHTHLFGANLWGRIAAFLTGVPVVSSEHGMDIWRSRLHAKLDTFLTPVNKKVIFVSEGVRKFYSKHNPHLSGKGRVLHNGIDVSSFEKESNRSTIRKDLGLKPTATVVGMVGRLVPEKAHVDFIEAIQILKDEGRDVTGLMVGEGPLLEALQARVREAKLDEQILFTGYQSDLSGLYQTMDVFVMCSVREGFPLTMLEAMAAGVPVVATRVGGIPECIEDGKDGLLVVPGDSMGLAESISRILEDKELKRNLVAHAKEKVTRHFSVERMVKEHELLYEEVLAS